MVACRWGVAACSAPLGAGGRAHRRGTTAPTLAVVAERARTRDRPPRGASALRARRAVGALALPAHASPTTPLPPRAPPRSAGSAWLSTGAAAKAAGQAMDMNALKAATVNNLKTFVPGITA